MNRKFLEQHLQLAERHIAQSERHIRHQRELLERLAAEGQDTTEAEYLLREFEHGLALHAADRNRTLVELDKPAR